MRSVTICLIAVALIVTACKKENEEPKRTVSYKISCTDCFVVWEENGVQKNATHQGSSWSVTFEGQKGSQVLLVAQNSSGNPQGVGATILLNGDTLQHAVSYCPISGTVVVSDTLE